MRTTLDLDDRLLMEVKSLAARERISLTRLIEQSLAVRLRTQANPPQQRHPALPVYVGTQGLQPNISDTLTHRALLDAADVTP
jgi:hypothetical protein